jgi:hypothetical protein
MRQWEVIVIPLESILMKMDLFLLKIMDVVSGIHKKEGVCAFEVSVTKMVLE